MNEKPVVVFDAGHGLQTSGKRCDYRLDPKSTREWTLNSRILVYAVENLQKQGNIEIIRTDDPSGATDVERMIRVNHSNNNNADLFISIHHNAGANLTTAGGTVIYYCSSDPRRATQAKQAYDCIVAQTGLVGNRYYKTINKAYTVIQYTKCAALLCELGYMDSIVDTSIILTDAYARKAAQGIVNFININFGFIIEEPEPENDKDETEESGLYRVQVGAYGVKNNADETEKKLKKAGFDTYVVRY